MKRFTRLTNAFPKKLANHAATVALHFMYYKAAAPAPAANADRCEQQALSKQTKRPESSALSGRCDSRVRQMSALRPQRP